MKALFGGALPPRANGFEMASQYHPELRVERSTSPQLPVGARLHAYSAEWNGEYREWKLFSARHLGEQLRLLAAGRRPALRIWLTGPRGRPAEVTLDPGAAVTVEGPLYLQPTR